LISLKKISSTDAWKIRGIVAGFAGFIWLSWQYSPVKILHRIFPDFFIFRGKETSCVLLNITGIPCPFCGMSRSLDSLLIGNFAGVFYFNPSSVIFFTFITVVCLIIFILSIFNKKIVFDNSRRISLIIIALILLIWVSNILFGHH
jgi:hypothetical protein